MNKREKNKQNTRQKILEAAKVEFIANGFLNTKTVDVAKRSGVAHGTLFFHFDNKDKLIIEIIEKELFGITGDLYNILNKANGFEELLESYLLFLEGEESLFSVIARELPFYSTELRRQIFFRESAVRNYFYQSIEDEINKGIFKNIDITYILDVLFGSINYYLSLNDVFGYKNTIIKEKKNKIIKNILMLLKK